MNEIEKAASTSLSPLLTGLPAPVQTSLIAALSRLLGGLAAFPAAWLQRRVQAYDDVTNGRSRYAMGLIDAALAKDRDNDRVLEAVAEIYRPEEVRKIVNRAQIAKAAVEEVRASDEHNPQSAPPEDDWMNRFMRFAEDASSERLQLLYAKILAGEIVRPGTFSTATLRIISELTQQIANDFEWFNAQRIGSEVPNNGQFGVGDGWARLVRLRDAGFVSATEAAIYQPAFKPMLAGTSPWMLGDNKAWLIFHMVADSGHRINVMNLTRSGLELALILPRPDIASNLIELSRRYQNPDICSAIDLHSNGAVERIWSQPLPPQEAEV